LYRKAVYSPWNPFTTSEVHHGGRKETDNSPQRIGIKALRCPDAKGRFVDIQTYKRAHGQDIKKKSKKEPGK
jgi:hypothetical protein